MDEVPGKSFARASYLSKKDFAGENQIGQHALPHWPQNLLPPGTEAPQWAHLSGISEVLSFPRNFVCQG